MAKKKQRKKKQNLKKTESDIIKKYGENSVYRIGSSKRLNIPAMSTGIYTLDRAIGIGGYPRGRMVELHGAESSAKTTVALKSIAACQAGGGVAVFIDAEHALDVTYAKRIGVDLDRLLICQPDSGEQALDITESFVLSGEVNLIVVDSVAGLVPEAELRGEMDKESIGLQARMLGRALRKLTGAVSKTETVIIFINQLRDKIGSYFGGQSTPGGRGLKHACSVRIKLRFKEKVKGVGTKFLGTIVKNKVAAPYEEFSFHIDDNFRRSKGIVDWIDQIDAAIDVDVITKRGSTLIYRKKKYKGMKTFRKQIMKDEKKHAAFIKRLKKALKEET